MRHTESGLAVPDFPLAYKQIIPDLADSSVAKYNYELHCNFKLEQTTAEQIKYHMLHRGGAVLVTIMLMTTTLVVFRLHGSIAALRWPAILAIVLLAVQIGLGAWTVWSVKNPRITTAHVVVGAVLLADSWILTLMSCRLLKIAKAEELPKATWKGVPA